MVFCNSRTHLPCQKALHLFISALTIVILLFFLPSANSLYFDFSQFVPNAPNIGYEGNAFSSGQVMELTKNQRDVSIDYSVGRAFYSQPVRLWDYQTRRLTDFTTHFSFIINALNQSSYGDGLAFFLAANGSYIPPGSGGGELGLFNPNSTENQLVAVEFDSFRNEWDPSEDHIGIDVNSIVSKANVTWRSSIKKGAKANAWVSYDSNTKNLSVFLTYAKSPVFGGNSSLFYIVDLREVLPEWIYIGFSAATGKYPELHQILSWDFNSTLEVADEKKKTGLIVGLVVGAAVLIVGLGCLIWFVFWWRSHKPEKKEDDVFDVSMNDEFVKGSGPKRFTYSELSLATNNFSEDGKLGEGGFGGVYRGFSSELNSNLAVKKVSRSSNQGKKEYVSEVKIISQVRHRNLVQLLGWCHERGDFLLVYEFMPNGSLDSHLFGGKALLPWALRYKIAMGLASALLYLHEEGEQCVVHRDIKSSNVMLDSGFNAKLGDFGLARLVDHELGSQTTVLAGTMGYLAPECVTTGKASKESDVYSFGVVALEIACGRRPVEPKAESGKVRMVEWVWELYGRGKLLDAADERLNNEFDEEQMERLMVLGLWCAHPDHNSRPSIRQVINVLNLEASLPGLPSEMPVAMYFAPPMNMCTFSYTSSATNGTTSSNFTASNCSGTSSNSSATALLHSRQTDVGIEF